MEHLWKRLLGWMTLLAILEEIVQTAKPVEKVTKDPDKPGSTIESINLRVIG